MKIYLSYSHKDSELAKQISDELLKSGLDVWDAETEIFPGDNWAEKVSNALEDSDAMVVLVSPDSLGSRTVQREIEYALGNKAYRNRLITVLIDSEKGLADESIFWILKKLKTIRLPRSEQTVEGINQVAEAVKSALGS